MTRRWWCELAWLGDGPDAHLSVVLEIDDSGRLSKVAPGSAASDAVRLPGLTLPGLVNAHSHAFHRALRARTHGADSFWSWRDAMYRVAARLDPDAYLELATAVFAEMTLAGITTVGEFHYLHRDGDGRAYASGDPMGAAIVGAAERAGVRLTLLDTCYLTGGIGEEPHGVQRRFSDGGALEWAARVDALSASETELVKIGAAIHSVRAVPPEAMTVVSEWAATRNAPLHAHVSEQPAENEACLSSYGLTPSALLDSLGILGPSFTAVHATHLTDGDVKLLGSSRSRICICPTTERELADGVGRASTLRAAGSGLCLGSDSNAVVNLFEEARAVELDERLCSGRRGLHSPPDLLHHATAGGAAALGWPGGGRLAVGAPADFVTVRTDGIGLAGTLDPGGGGAASAAVFAAGPADVTTVVVGGRTVVSDSRHLAVGDVGQALHAAIRRVLAG